jgi:hypothetical protein
MATPVTMTRTVRAAAAAATSLLMAQPAIEGIDRALDVEMGGLPLPWGQPWAVAVVAAAPAVMVLLLVRFGGLGPRGCP